MILNNAPDILLDLNFILLQGKHVLESHILYLCLLPLSFSFCSIKILLIEKADTAQHKLKHTHTEPTQQGQRKGGRKEGSGVGGGREGGREASGPGT